MTGSPDHVRREPVLAAVGELQFDVVASRLESEYGVETILEPLTFTAIRWAAGENTAIAELANSRGRRRMRPCPARP